MKVKAQTNIKYGDRWYVAGETMNVLETDLAELKGMVILPDIPPEPHKEASPTTEFTKDSGFLAEIQTVDQTKPDAGRKPTRRPRKRAE